MNPQLVPLKLYGIPNCNTVKKARDWLTLQGIEYVFFDFKKSVLSPEIAQNWLQQCDKNELINRKGLTWRSLSSDEKQMVNDISSVLTLMLQKTSVIKRPVLEQNGKLLYIGFDETAYEKIFNVKDQS
jgi:Spx/MgsR family transcriptional regulator